MGRSLSPDQRLWYRRTFPIDWPGRRTLLHFGAVDWHAVVTVNGKTIGEHKGGYAPFSFDITDALVPGRDQELVVAVSDPTDTGTQPRGKQVLEPNGIWYTAVSGIWQTVWLEPVPEVSIASVIPVPDLDRRTVRIRIALAGNAAGLRLRAESNGVSAEANAGAPVELALRDPKPWSPESPHLHPLTVSLLRNGKPVDRVESYFAMRKISLGKDEHGRVRLMLNNAPYFQMGPLDQGWWPDGLYTAPTDEALKFDIEYTRSLGFNLARKHVKVEPARWYYHCDRLGLLVWQDMPSAFATGPRPNPLLVSPLDREDGRRDAESAREFEQELRELIGGFSFFPSIVMWVPFNEGWGQYDTQRIARLVKSLDPSRLVNSVSGWTDRGAGDVYDAHIYPGPGMEVPRDGRATVLGEFGGLGLPLEGHLWLSDRNWGYQTFGKQDELARRYEQVAGNLRGLQGFGLSAAIYTQTTDVEGEVNGLITYDREAPKFDPAGLKRFHQIFYTPAPAATLLMAPGQEWKYSTAEPATGWSEPAFDASAWKTGPAPFQSAENSVFPARTPWTEPRIWMRRSFDVSGPSNSLWLTLLLSATDVEVFVNGTSVLKLSGMRAAERHYTHVDLSRHAGLLRQGSNVIAIAAGRTGARRGIDAGLYRLE